MACDEQLMVGTEDIFQICTRHLHENVMGTEDVEHDL